MVLHGPVKRPGRHCRKSSVVPTGAGGKNRALRLFVSCANSELNCRHVFLQRCCPLKGDAEREMRLLTDMYGEKQCRHEPIPRHAAHDL